MRWLGSAAYLYGAVNLVFGILGYVNKGSVASLIAGGAAGLLAILGAYLSTKKPFVGFGLVALVSIGIAGRFFKPGILDGQVYPAMILSILSFAMLGLLVLGHTQNRRRSSN